MKIVPFLILLLPFWGYGQPNNCEKLFQIYNPKDITTKTSTIIINELEECVDIDNRGFYQTTSRSMDNTGINPDKSIITQSESTGEFTIQNLFETLEHSQIRRDAIVDSYDNLIAYNFSQNKPLVELTKLGCYAYGGKNCVKISKFVIDRGLDLLNLTHTVHEREDLELEFARLHKMLLKNYGIDTRECGRDKSCIIKVASPYLKQMTEHQKITFADYYDPKTASTKAKEELSDDEVDESSFTDNFKDKVKQAAKKKEDLDKSVLEATAIITQELGNLTESFANFQQLVNEGFEQTQRQFDLLSRNDSIIVSELMLHQSLIEQNAIDIAIMQDIIIGNLDNNQKLDLYSNCLDGKEGCPTKILESLENDSVRMSVEKKVVELKKIKKASDFIRATELIGQGLDIGYELALTLGLKGEAAVKTGEVLKYVGAALQVGKGIAQIVSGDGQAIAGVFTAVQAINSLFGKEAPPDPIVVLRKEMHERFDRIEKQLNVIIDLQIEIHQNLAENIELNRVLMHSEFNNLNRLLTEVIVNQDRIASQLGHLLNDDLLACFPIIQSIHDDSLLQGTNYYNNYLQIYGKPGCEECLIALRKRLTAGDENFIINIDDREELNLSVFSVYKTDNTETELKSFNQLTTFFKWYYKKQDKLYFATQQLLLPIRSIDKNQNLFCEDSLTLNLQLNPNNVLNPTFYLDVITFRKLVNIYNTFYPFFEIYDPSPESSSYAPLSLDEFITLSSKELSSIESDVIASNKRMIDRDTRTFSQLSNIMLAQQALMSGHLLIQPLYYIIYQDQYMYDEDGRTLKIDGVPVKEFAIKILKENPVLAQNFANYVLRKNYKLNQYIYKDSTILDSLPVNENFHQFESFAYHDTHPKVYIPGVDSFYIDSMSTNKINLRILEKSSYIDKLDFEKFEGHELVYLKISEPNNLGEHTEVNIPLPDVGTILSNTLSFNYEFQYATETSQMIDALSTDILLTNGLRDNWLELSQFKLAILNSLKAQE